MRDVSVSNVADSSMINYKRCIAFGHLVKWPENWRFI